MAQQISAPRVDESAVQAFLSSARGKVIRPGDLDYDEARRLWNAMIDKRPGWIVRCGDVTDVVPAVNFARAHDLPLAVRGGGHNIAGTALCDDGVVIDLSQMKDIRIDRETQSVRVQPGATWGDVDRETQAFGFSVPSGIVSTTGVAGLTLGGGFGWLTRSYGYTSDNLIAVDIVTADGESLTASETSHPDLFWGVRGGGGNFGVVTSFHFRMRPVGPTVMAGMVLFSIDRAPEILRFFRAFTASAPDELGALFLMRIVPPSPALPAHLHGLPVAGIAVCYAGSLEEGAKVLTPLKDLADPLLDVVGPKPFQVHQTLFDATNPAGHHYYWKSDYFSKISDAAGEVLVERGSAFPSPQSVVLLMHLGGAMSRIPEDASAASHRDAAYILNIAGSWLTPEETQPCVTWARSFWSAIHEHSSGNVYVNFLTADESQDRVRAAYGPAKYERLVALKNRYDPNNLFRFNQNIRPTT